MNYTTLREAVSIMVEEDLGQKDDQLANVVMASLVLSTPIVIMSLAEREARHAKELAPLADNIIDAEDLINCIPHGVLSQVLSAAHHMIVSEG